MIDDEANFKRNEVRVCGRWVAHKEHVKIAGIIATLPPAKLTCCFKNLPPHYKPSRFKDAELFVRCCSVIQTQCLSIIRGC